uniref:LysM domain-containing protein n=2 Tax=Gloeothece TaxID=28070 RepID=E0UDZ2_GLOV7|nr:protein of unknown function DUF928 [Gloeothece verrucosa PCC 7822]
MNKIFLALGVSAFAVSLLLESVVDPSFAFQTFPPTSNYSDNFIAQAARTYKVKLGDTLLGIAYNNGLTLQQLLSFNPSLRNNPDLIGVGQVINLSQPTSGTKPSKTAQKPPTRQSVQTFNLPTIRRTGSSRMGARRGDPKQECRSNPNDNLRVLLPVTNFGYTLQDHPTFFWYMPELKTQAERLELKVRPVEADSYQTYQFISNNQNAGVMSVTLPPEMGAFEEGKEYQWEIRVYCSRQMFIAATGNIQRLSTNNPQLASQLEKASVEDYPAILAQAGVWYDAMATLAALRAENPTDTSLRADWSNLLKMIGFENIANAPILAREEK